MSWFALSNSVPEARIRWWAWDNRSCTSLLERGRSVSCMSIRVPRTANVVRVPWKPGAPFRGRSCVFDHRPRTRLHAPEQEAFDKEYVHDPAKNEGAKTGHTEEKRQEVSPGCLRSEFPAAISSCHEHGNRKGFTLMVVADCLMDTFEKQCASPTTLIYTSSFNVRGCTMSTRRKLCLVFQVLPKALARRRPSQSFFKGR